MKSQKAAIAVFILIITVSIGSNQGFAVGLAFSTLWFFALMRFGFIAAILTLFTMDIITSSPITLQISAWYSGYGYLVLAIIAAIVLYAFRTALGGRPLLAPSRLDD